MKEKKYATKYEEDHIEHYFYDPGDAVVLSVISIIIFLPLLVVFTWLVIETSEFLLLLVGIPIALLLAFSIYTIKGSKYMDRIIIYNDRFVIKNKLEKVYYWNEVELEYYYVIFGKHIGKYGYKIIMREDSRYQETKKGALICDLSLNQLDEKKVKAFIPQILLEEANAKYKAKLIK